LREQNGDSTRIICSTPNKVEKPNKTNTMNLSTLDWGLIIAFFAVSLGIGIYASRKSGQNSSEFFLSGRNMPWWLLGVSMVATTFSADTPNLVTGLVRESGVAGNWGWWAFLYGGSIACRCKVW